MTLILTLLACAVSPPQPDSWTPIESPFPGQDCAHHRSWSFYGFSETVICAPQAPSCESGTSSESEESEETWVLLLPMDEV